MLLTAAIFRWEPPSCTIVLCGATCTSGSLPCKPGIFRTCGSMQESSVASFVWFSHRRSLLRAETPSARINVSAHDQLDSSGWGTGEGGHAGIAHATGLRSGWSRSRVPMLHYESLPSSTSEPVAERVSITMVGCIAKLELPDWEGNIDNHIYIYIVVIHIYINRRSALCLQGGRPAKIYCQPAAQKPYVGNMSNVPQDAQDAQDFLTQLKGPVPVVILFHINQKMQCPQCLESRAF